MKGVWTTWCRLAAVTLGLSLATGVAIALDTHAPVPPVHAVANSTITDSPVGRVNEVAVGPNDTTYVVGDFTSVGAATGGFASLDAATGLVNRNFPSITGSVWVVEPDGSGGYFIGGNFTSVDGQPRGSLAHLLPDGTLDIAWMPAADPNGIVLSMARVGTTLYVGGEFTSINGTTRTNLAAISATTGSLLSWDPGADLGVYAMATDDSALYIGGNFQTVDGQPRNRIAAFDVASSTLVSSWDPNANLSVYALEARNGVIYVGGNFSTIGGEARGQLAAVAPVASGDDTATTWNPGPGQQVNTFAFDDTTIYVGGAFTTVGASTRHRAAAFRTDDTGTLLSWNPDAGNQVRSIYVSTDGIYLGGYFTTINGSIARNGLARVDTVLGTATAWDPAPTASRVENITPLVPGSAILVGGDFTHVNVVPRARAAAIDTNGRVTPWTPSLNCQAGAIALAPPLAYLGGCFTTVNGVSRTRAAAVRIDDTGSVTAWDPQFNNQVLNLAVIGSTVYAVGEFTSVNGGTTRNRAAAVSALDDSLATPWDPNLNLTAHDIQIEGGTAYIGGEFTTVKGGAATRIRVAAFTVDDTANPTAWNPNANDAVYDIEVATSTVYLAGRFTTINGGTSRNFAASVSRSGIGAVTPWNPDVICDRGISSPCNSSVARRGARAIEISGSTAFLAGYFTTVNGGPYLGLVALQTDDTGSVNGSWTPTVYRGPIGPLQGIFEGLAVAGGRLRAVGEFLGIGLGNVGYAANAAFLPTAVTAPLAPTGVAAAPGDASASIAWTAGYNGGSSVTRVDVALDDTSQVYASSSNTTSPLTITGLANGTTYTAYVRLANSAGNGDWSLASAPFTPQAAPRPPIPSSPPGPPTQVAATPGNASATVNWTAPIDTGTYPIDGYVVRATPGGRSCTTSATTCTVTGLTNGTSYTFTVTASSAAGSGPESAPSAPVTPRTIPGSPAAVAATPGDARAIITWSVPADDGGSPITGYRVTTIPTSDGCTVTTTTCILDGLTNGREYVVSVVAVNEAGNSAPATVTVTPRGKAGIVITGTRSRNDPGLVKVLGTVTNLDTATVQPYVRLGRAQTFQPSLTQATVGDEGRFRWQRATSKRITVYVEAAGATSNRVTIPAR